MGNIHFSSRSKSKPSTAHFPFLGEDADMARICSLLERGEITDCRPLYIGSNRVFLVTLQKKAESTRGIYKPCWGERPLWDFPDGTLYKREYAAYLMSQILGWSLVPPTLIRGGPYGIGSLQWFVHARSRDGYYALKENRPAEIKQIAIFDLLVNNTDRKASHCIEAADGRVWAVDHGLTFNVVPKLRTVIWDFAGQLIPGEFVSDVVLLQQKLSQVKPVREALFQLLDETEIEALEHRVKRIINNPVFPYPESYRSVPWPPF